MFYYRTHKLQIQKRQTESVIFVGWIHKRQQ